MRAVGVTASAIIDGFIVVEKIPSVDIVDAPVSIVVDPIIGNFTWIDPYVLLQIDVVGIEPLINDPDNNLTRSKIVVAPSFLGTTSKRVGGSRSAKCRWRVVAVHPPKLAIEIAGVVADSCLLENVIWLGGEYPR